MPRKSHVHVVAATTVLVFAVGIILSGDEVQSDWLRFYAYATTVAVLLLGIWDRWLWRNPIGQRFTATPRDVSGVWRGTLSSQWTDPSTGSPVPAKTAYIVVRQTASTLSVTMLTDEMRSTSSVASISLVDGVAGLEYIYLSRPKSSVEHRSRMHVGGAALDVTGKPATRLHGRYWTDRESRGELDFTDRLKGAVDDYASAERRFNKLGD